MIGLLVLVSSCCFAQLSEPGAFTANELLTRAREAYGNGDYQTAEAYFEAFDRDFGESPEAKAVIEQNTPLIALCKITNGKFAEARPWIETALNQPKLPLEIREELSFWQAIGWMQDGNYEEAQHAFGRFFQESKFGAAKRQEALVMFGTCYVIQGAHQTAAEFFEAQIPKLRLAKSGRENAGRGVVLALFSLIQAENYDGALSLVQAEYPNIGDISQLVSFQNLALQLGSKFMELERYHEAVACLQRIWTRERLLKHQNDRLAELKLHRAVAASDPRTQSRLLQIDGTIKRTERELENFKKTENFDSALRFRLAMTFQGMKRYREAALIMEAMLEDMDPNPVVETASVAVIQCWMELGRWPKAIEAAENYLLVFGDKPDNKHIPQVMFMQADALLQMQNLEESSATYRQIAELFPDEQLLAPKALFMHGYTSLLQNLNDRAISVFDRILADFEDGSSEQDAFYWKGMAMSYKKEYEACSEHMQAYLEAYADAGLKYEAEAEFRIAFCTFCIADYPASIESFSLWLEKHGNGADVDEARLLLGDAHLAEGQIDEGIAAYKSINPASKQFFEDGWFKTGKALKLSEEIEAMREHFLVFLERYPESNRMPEAVYWIGWTHVADEEPEKAKDIYWKTLREHGDNPDMFAIEDLLVAMPKVYKRLGPEALDGFEKELTDLSDQAGEDQKTLALRALWARANLADKVEYRDILLSRAGSLVDPENHNPLIIADCADGARGAGNLAIAEMLYKELRRWHPNSVHKGRALAGLGFIEREKGNAPAAISLFERFEEQTFGSYDLQEVILAKSELQHQEGQTTSAIASLEKLLEEKTTPSQFKARALLALGDLYVAQSDDQKAIAYYERIYLIYGKYRELVASAYWRRGQALERMSLNREAFEVYTEFAQRVDLDDTKEINGARARAAALETTLPPQTPIKEEETP
ncbi:MAG: tetratricopeptide (TPR) repeat protein [Verrucomicrobiales bacterium]